MNQVVPIVDLHDELFKRGIPEETDDPVEAGEVHGIHTADRQAETCEVNIEPAGYRHVADSAGETAHIDSGIVFCGRDLSSYRNVDEIGICACIHHEETALACFPIPADACWDDEFMPTTVDIRPGFHDRSDVTVDAHPLGIGAAAQRIGRGNGGRVGQRRERRQPYLVFEVVEGDEVAVEDIRADQPILIVKAPFETAAPEDAGVGKSFHRAVMKGQTADGDRIGARQIDAVGAFIAESADPGPLAFV